MKGAQAALGFLTIIPVGTKRNFEEKDFGDALFFFPIIGLIIGFFLCLTFFVFSWLPDTVSSLMILLVSVFLTGALHIDGFADTCDGLHSGYTKEKALEVMRDSRTGVMGVIGIACLLLAKFVLFSTISRPLLCNGLILMTVFSRWTQVFVCYKSNYARKMGKAKIFIEQAKLVQVLTGGIFTFILFVFLMKLPGALIFLLAVIAVYIFRAFIIKRIGGMTGDTIGAVNEISELCVLLGTVFFCY